MHGAGAAERHAAAELGAGHAQHVAQDPKQRRVGVDVDAVLSAIDLQGEGHIASQLFSSGRPPVVAGDPGLARAIRPPWEGKGMRGIRERRNGLQEVCLGRRGPAGQRAEPEAWLPPWAVRSIRAGRLAAAKRQRGVEKILEALRTACQSI
ncbi:hypothetical protein D3C84_558450 [compost metagenome]